MPYYDHFTLADDVISHLDSIMSSISDPFIQSRYVGFVAVTATTVYELAIKDIFCEFGEKKHKVLGSFIRSYFDRINGKIKIDSIRNEYVKRFGDKYVEKFKEKLDRSEQHWLRTKKVSIKSSYNNIIEWRNEFAHAGKIPSTVTYNEITQSYIIGKEVIKCLAESMHR